MDHEHGSGFQDRRNGGAATTHPVERRQFAENRTTLSGDVRELAEAIDAFKLAQQRRFVTLADVLDVVKSLGYHK
jgi:hypothetical protein